MNRSRRLILTAAAVSALGITFSFSARVTGTARAAVGPVPPEALALPADSAVVMGFDVRALTGSQFYAKFGGEGEPGRVEALAEIERKTGLNPARDIDSVVVAVRPQTEDPKSAEPALDGVRRHRPENALVFVTGRFDAARLEASIPETGKASKERRDGVTIYREASGKSNGAVALLDAGILVAGDTASVDTFLANRASGRGIRDNAALVSLLESVEPGSTFWAVGGPSVLSRVTSEIGGPAANLPAIKQVVAYGHLDPEVGMTATAEAADAKSATKIADVLRGFSALLSLQAGQKAELAQIADSISVATEDDKVHVKATITHELIDSLKKSAGSHVRTHKGVAPDENEIQ
ncbi:MAG: hypothetical protein JJE39_05135 [Vicinamibacteria bacterium]|nr:hypothetical protein [Vicinamibacteria bacterium]